MPACMQTSRSCSARAAQHTSMLAGPASTPTAPHRYWAAKARMLQASAAGSGHQRQPSQAGRTLQGWPLVQAALVHVCRQHAAMLHRCHFCRRGCGAKRMSHWLQRCQGSLADLLCKRQLLLLLLTCWAVPIALAGTVGGHRQRCMGGCRWSQTLQGSGWSCSTLAPHRSDAGWAGGRGTSMRMPVEESWLISLDAGQRGCWHGRLGRPGCRLRRP